MPLTFVDKTKQAMLRFRAKQALKDRAFHRFEDLLREELDPNCKGHKEAIVLELIQTPPSFNQSLYHWLRALEAFVLCGYTVDTKGLQGIGEYR